MGIDSGVAAALVLGDPQEGVVPGRAGRGAAVVLETENAIVAAATVQAAAILCPLLCRSWLRGDGDWLPSLAYDNGEVGVPATWLVLG